MATKDEIMAAAPLEGNVVGKYLLRKRPAQSTQSPAADDEQTEPTEHGQCSAAGRQAVATSTDVQVVILAPVHTDQMIEADSISAIF